MAKKQFVEADIGVINVYKRRGSKKITLKVAGDKINITQPFWMPYSVGYSFAVKNRSWINNQISKQPASNINNGMQIGKTYKLNIIYNSVKTRTLIKNQVINVYLVNSKIDLNNKEQLIIKKAIKRALKLEADSLLTERINNIAASTGISYSSVRFKAMKSRWGSCTNNKLITLNIYLLMCPWELIDYVIIHELAHTKHLNHGASFWQFVEKYIPDYKIRRKRLKELQSSVLSLQP